MRLAHDVEGISALLPEPGGPSVSKRHKRGKKKAQQILANRKHVKVGDVSSDMKDVSPNLLASMKASLSSGYLPVQ